MRSFKKSLNYSVEWCSKAKKKRHQKAYNEDTENFQP